MCKGAASHAVTLGAVYVSATSVSHPLIITTSELESQFAPIIINIHLVPSAKGQPDDPDI